MFRDVVKPYLDRGLVSCQRHPDWPDLAIFNYTPACQFGRHWDDVTQVCRGLVVDLARDRVVARPFRKFFGLRELPGLGLSLPVGEPEVTVKLDGALGISYRTPDGRLRWATRGSFTSRQARVAEQMWGGRDDVPPGLTLLCEIIHRETRVVVPYDFQDLVLVGAVETETGRDLGWDDLAVLGREVGLRVVERVPFDLEEAVARARQMRADSGEGFVLRWPDGFRVKVKAPEYLEAHRVVVGLQSRRSLAEAWERGEVWRLLEKVPDDTELAARVAELDLLYRQVLDTCAGFFEARKGLAQKEYALQVQAQLPEWLWPVAFALKKGGDGAGAAKRAVVKRWLADAT